MAYQLLNSCNMQAGINPSAPPLSPESENSLSDGSWNAIVSGDGYTRPFRGLLTQGANTGSRKMLHVGKTWGGIKDIGATQGSGSFIEDIGRSRWGIGAGQPHIAGTDVSGYTLSTNLKVSISNTGVYAAPVTAGLGQPSSPEIGIIDLTGDVSNSISAKIERYRASTGARSLASTTSAVIIPKANRVRVTFPAAEAGQTHWRVYFTFQGFGGTGVHYLAPYNAGSADITEVIVAAGVVDGIARSLEFNVKDGDLIPIEASFDDYSPPAATHLLRLENVMNLVGCYVDAERSPTSTDTGVVIAVSKQNNYESYVPTHLLYLAEQVVDTLARPIDDYGYIACQNSIYAIQYVGDRGDELPPCTITTILPDIGIEYASNWCHFRGRLLMYTAQGNLLLMDESGSFDTDFAKPVTKILKTFTTAGTAVGYDPSNDSIVVGCGKHLLVYSLQTQQWRQIWLPDISIAGNVTSMVSAQRTLYISITNGGSVTAYAYDANSGSLTVPLSFVTNYQTRPTGNAAVKDIYELALSGETEAASAQMAVCIAANRTRSVLRRVSVTASSSIITASDSGVLFKSDADSLRVILFGDGIVAGQPYFHGRISNVLSSTSVELETFGAMPFSPLASKSDLLMFIGTFTQVVSFTREHIPNLSPYIAEARSYQVATWFQGVNDVGNLFTCDVFGDAYASTRAFGISALGAR